MVGASLLVWELSQLTSPIKNMSVDRANSFSLRPPLTWRRFGSSRQSARSASPPTILSRARDRFRGYRLGQEFTQKSGTHVCPRTDIAVSGIGKNGRSIVSCCGNPLGYVYFTLGQIKIEFKLCLTKYLLTKKRFSWPKWLE